MNENFILGAVIGLIITIIVGLIFVVSGVVTAWAWNLIVPLFWKAAPHLTWLHGIALGLLLGLLKGIVHVSNRSSSK